MGRAATKSSDREVPAPPAAPSGQVPPARRTGTGWTAARIGRRRAGSGTTSAPDSPRRTHRSPSGSKQRCGDQADAKGREALPARLMVAAISRALRSLTELEAKVG